MTKGLAWVEKKYYSDARKDMALYKVFQFADFAEALVFTNELGALAEKAQHHPDINLSWGMVSVWLTTHDAHGITDKDHSLAKSIDQINQR